MASVDKLIKNIKEGPISNCFEYVEVYEQIEGTNDHPLKARIPTNGKSVETQEFIMSFAILPNKWYFCTSCIYHEEQKKIPLQLVERPTPIFLHSL